MYTVQVILNEPIVKRFYLLAAGVCFPFSWGGSLDMQCRSPGRKHWLLPVNVFAWVLHLPIRCGCHHHRLGDKYYCKMDHSPDSSIVVLLGICAIHCWFCFTSQKGLGCVSIVAAVYLHGMVSTDQVTYASL